MSTNVRKKRVDSSVDQRKNCLQTLESPSKVQFSFRRTYSNPDYKRGKIIPLRSCHIHNNSSQNDLRNLSTGEPVYERIYGVVQDKPRWITELNRNELTPAGMETSIYTTNDLKSSKDRMIANVVRFCDFYEPLYQARKVSIFFITFTRANYSDKTIATMLECVKKRFKALKWNLRAYLWTFEAKENPKMDGGFHLHYHLVIVTDRVKIDRIPDELRFESLWGQRTGVEFIKRSVRNYLSKYLYKTDAKVTHRRRYGVSRKFI